MKNSYTFGKFVIELVALIAAKRGWLGGNVDTFMPIFSPDGFRFD